MNHDCWKQIGVWGDRACPELKTFIHCRNCPVYSTAGRTFLEREAPAGYVHEWTNLLADEKVGAHSRTFVQAPGTLSIVIFRLGVEWLALSAGLFKEVTQIGTIRTLPHRSNSILLGLVNIRGEIHLCVSLATLLKLETAPSTSPQHLNHTIYQRMVVVEKDGNRWVFPVDEIYGVHRIHPDELGNVPATVFNVSDTYTKGMINWQGQSISYLDDELLFYTLNKKIL